MATSLQIINTIRTQSAQFYKDRVPVATQTNIENVTKNVLGNDVLRNEFLNQLINKVAMTVVSSRMAKNPLAKLKKGKMPMGSYIEDIFVNPAIAKEYTYTSEDFLKITPPDVKSLYYSINRQDKYPVVISEIMLERAFTNDGAMNELLNQIIISLYSGDNIDEFLLMKQLVSQAVKKGHVIKTDLGFRPDNMTKEQATQLIKELRTDSLNFNTPSSLNNSYSVIKPSSDKGKDVITFTPPNEQILLIDNRIYSAVNVDVLANAFNLDKTDFIGQVIPVDNFNGEPVIAMLVDSAWFKVYDSLPPRLKMFDNGDTLNIHYWLHHHQVMAYSMFANAKAYVYTPQG